MTQTRRPLALLLATLTGAAIAAGSLGHLSPTIDCVPVDAYTLPDDSIASLLEQGWRGSPSDGSDLLYPPTCLPADAQLMVPVGSSYAIVKG